MGQNTNTSRTIERDESSVVEQRPHATVRVSSTSVLSALLLDCACILILAYAVLFVNLGAHSLGMTDEVFEVGAAQEMMASGNWLLPTIDGKAFFDKPPFKMWLSSIVVAIVGESNFSYRVLDACFGVGTLLLTYFLSRLLFASRLQGLFAVLLFLGCQIFVLHHGMRHAVQDSLLVFFSTAIITLGVLLERTIKSGAKGSVSGSICVGIGLLAGCAFLTKSAGALMPFIVFGAYLTLSGKLFWFIKHLWRQLLLGAFVAVSIASTYFLTHCLMTPGACYSMFYHHVYKRVNGGVHNIAGPSFYFIRIFIDRAIYAPEVLSLSLVYGLWRWLRGRDSRYALLVLWSMLPVALYTVASTKLSWYIAPALPAMALVVSATVFSAVAAIIRIWKTDCTPLNRGRLSSRPVSHLALLLLLALFVAYSGVTAVYAYVRNADEVSARTKRIALDLVAEELIAADARSMSKSGARLEIARFNAPRFALDERNYHNMLKPLLRDVSSLDELEHPDFIFTRLHDIPAIAQRWPVYSFKALPPIRYRHEWIAIVGLTEDTILPHFEPWKNVIDFAGTEFTPMFGFGGPEKFHSLGVRYMTGDFAAFRFQGHATHDLLGAELWINLAPQLGSSKEPLRLEVAVNGQGIQTLQPRPHALDTYIVKIPPGVVKTGENAVFFRASFAQTPIAGNERPVLFNWASIRFSQQGHTSIRQ